MRLRYTLTALRQIDQAIDYIEARSPQGAASIREPITAGIALVQEHPFAGQATSRQGTRRVVLTPYPYVIFYRVTADEVIISRFRHAARKPSSMARPT